MLVLVNSQQYFFWDTVQLGSKHAHHFYENGLIPSFLPEHINSGHIPTFGYYLAVVWTLFGKTLSVSHFSMVPFIILIIFSLKKVIDHQVQKELAGLGLLMVLADPTLMAQCTLMSPEVWLVAFFLGLLYAFQSERHWLQMLFILLLGLTSLRGIMLVLAIFMYFLLKRKSLKEFQIFIPAGILVGAYYILHLRIQGWVGVHDSSPWAESFQLANLKIIFKNLAVVIWRFLDFNRWVIYAVLFFLMFKSKKFNFDSFPFRGILISSTIVLIGFTVFFSGLSAHRYYLPLYLLIALSMLHLLNKTNLTLKIKKVILCVSSIFLLAGNFIIYPDHVSQGWDSSLAYMPYTDIRKDIEEHLEKNGIPFYGVATVFPDLSFQKYYTLSESKQRFAAAEEQNPKYILISNIHNDWTDEQKSSLVNKKLVLEYKKRGVWYKLLSD